MAIYFVGPPMSRPSSHMQDRAVLQTCYGDRIKAIGYEEALSMIDNGVATRVSRPKAPLVVRLKEVRRQTAPMGTTITLSEMEAIAGLRGPRHRSRRRRRAGQLGNFVDAARTKFEVWPLVGDTKAVRVGPRCHG